MNLKQLPVGSMLRDELILVARLGLAPVFLPGLSGLGEDKLQDLRSRNQN